MSITQTYVCVIDIAYVCIDAISKSRHIANRGKGIVLESKQKGTAMQLEGAVIKEQGQTFAVVVVLPLPIGMKRRRQCRVLVAAFRECRLS